MLLLSLFTLFAGPLLYHWMRSGGLIARTFDRVIVTMLVLLLALLLIPEAFEGLGWIAVLLMATGYLLPGLLESGLKKSAHTLHLISMLLALLGLVLHAMLDGAGLAGSELQDGHGLGVAIVVHRLGVGLVLWLIFQPAFGRNVAIGVLALISAATVLGFALSEMLLPLAGREVVQVIESLIIGTIIHSLVHRGHVARHAAPDSG